MSRALIGGVAVVACLPGGMALAQSAPPQESLTSAIAKLKGNEGVSKAISSLSEDIPMTTAPAAYVLGIAGDQVPRYTTFRAFATALVHGVGKDGKSINSVSAEIAPLLALKVLTLEDQRDWARRALARTTFSVVTTEAKGEETARSAYGLQSVLYSHELDQAINLAGSPACTAAADQFLESLKPGAPAPVLDPSGLPAVPGADDALKRRVAECQTAIDNILNRWNQTMVALGFGQAFKSADNSVSGLKKANQVAWLTGSWGFGSGSGRDANERLGGLLTLHARLERDGIADTPGASAPQMAEDADLFGASLRYGKSRFNGLLEYSHRRSRISGLADENRRRTVIGVEYRLKEDLYLSFGVSSETGRRDGNNTNLALANLNWGFGDKAILAP